jgi:enterochelin esterase-like enzyme
VSKRFVAISLGFLLTCWAPRPAEAQQSSNHLSIRSSRLITLEKQLKSRNVAVLKEFWREMTARGAPIVEPIRGDEKHVAVTFVYRGDSQIRNVLVFSVLGVTADGTFTAGQLTQNRLVRLPGTDVWFRTYKVRRDARFTYYFSPNDSLLPSARRKDIKDWDTLQPDPLNPHRFLVHEPERDWVRSVVELPGASPVAWNKDQPGVPKGHLEAHNLHSSFLRNERRFWIYTPASYSREGQPYRLLVLLDGWVYSQMIPTTTTLDNLLAAGRIHPLIVLMVDQKDRTLELGCYEAFNQFLVRELIPWVREHYHVTLNPAETIVGGMSRGGLAAAFAGLRHPEIFGKVLSQSGYYSWDPDEDRNVDEEALQFEWIIRQFATHPRLPLRFYLEVGLLERKHEFPDSPSLLQSNRHMRDVLVAKGYSIRYQEVASGHEYFAFAAALPDALLSLVGRNGPDK